MSPWREVPKVELHLHLEGAAPPAFIRQLAAEKGIALEGVFDPQGGYKWHDFASFLETYHAAFTVLQTPEDFGALAQAVGEKSRSDGVFYTEIFVCPDICGAGDPGAWSAHLDAIVAGLDQVDGLESRLIGTVIRNLGSERAEAMARVIAQTDHPRLTGFCMAGEERFGRAQDYTRAFQIAQDAGLGLTSHAGELAGAHSVAETLDHLPVTRIGHGVRAIEDPALVSRLAEAGTVLEVCPGSNIALEVFASWQDHPLNALREAGVAVTVSTDDPPYFHTDLVAEYEAISATFGWTRAEFDQANLVALEAAFCDAETKARLKEMFRQ
ncbi:MAG: adenosine deaminase [Pseudomonadota bacterium]